MPFMVEYAVQRVKNAIIMSSDEIVALLNKN
jgi:hypothetical protein